ncbi:DUF1295 domain-containing protein [Pararhizobium sp. IMCC21322]|uniref:DUF1295 domain-containing protein n=1 Tax=Pararhizobium sp. IMCC21322 TaxID=3067903 RepID=UPI002741B20D|nr:DUF1295 domain-containing protein [Pararhizobium sp. IMCC21322]
MVLFASLMVTMAAFAVLWALHLPLKNAGIVDFYWGVGFLVIGAVYALRIDQLNLYQLLFFGMIAVWAVRLSFYLITRFAAHTSEDQRYAAMRTSGGPSFWWASLPKIFLLQALVMWIIATPLHTALILPSVEPLGGALLGFGVILFCVGLVFEAIADHQLARFKSSNPEPTKLLRTGLWAWARHPNYFGEALLWWGLGLYALALTGSFVSLLGPLVLTIVLVGVTGRMTDDHMQNSRGAAFSQYKLETSAILPLPPTLYQHITKKNRPAI